MRKILVSAMLFICLPILLTAQFDDRLKQDIINTGYIHRPLPLDYTKSFETSGTAQKTSNSTTTRADYPNQKRTSLKERSKTSAEKFAVISCLEVLKFIQ